MSAPLATLAANALQDAVVAAPAAFVRALLENRIRPGAKLLFTLGVKVRVLLLSIACGVLAGQIAREVPRSTQYVPLTVLVIAVALLVQESVMRRLIEHAGQRAGGAIRQWLGSFFPRKTKKRDDKKP
jgi:hypothetical protein